MANRYFQEARNAVNEAKQVMYHSYTSNSKSEANEKLNRAKQALSQAFADSTMAEREQLMDLQQSLYEFAEEFQPKS